MNWIDYGILALEHFANGTMEALPPPGSAPEVHYHSVTDVCLTCDIGTTERRDSGMPGPESEET